MDWNKKAKLYDLVFSLPGIKHGREKESKNFIELFGIARKESEIEIVLDIACGTGKNIERLLGEHKDIKIFGIDIAREMLKKARKQACGFSLCSALSLPFKAESFDFAYSLGLTEYLDNFALKKFFGELERILKSKSFAVVSFTPKSYLNIPRYMWGMKFYQRECNEFIEFAENFEVVDTRETKIQKQILLRKRK